MSIALYFRIYGQKNYLLKVIPKTFSGNVDIFGNLKKRVLPRNDDIFGYMRKKPLFWWCRNNVIIVEILIFTQLYKKKNMIQCNVLFLDILIFTDFWSKNDFFKLISKTSFDIYRDMDKKRFFKNNVFFLKMLIYSEIWAKTAFPKWFQNNFLFHETLILTKTIFQKMCITLKCWILRRYGQKTIF